MVIAKNQLGENFQVTEYPLDYSEIDYKEMEKIWHSCQSAQSKPSTESESPCKKDAREGVYWKTNDYSEREAEETACHNCCLRAKSSPRVCQKAHGRLPIKQNTMFGISQILQILQYWNSNKSATWEKIFFPARQWRETWRQSYAGMAWEQQCQCFRLVESWSQTNWEFVAGLLKCCSLVLATWLSWSSFAKKNQDKMRKADRDLSTLSANNDFLFNKS